MRTPLGSMRRLFVSRAAIVGGFVGGKKVFAFDRLVAALLARLGLGLPRAAPPASAPSPAPTMPFIGAISFATNLFTFAGILLAFRLRFVNRLVGRFEVERRVFGPVNIGFRRLAGS